MKRIHYFLPIPFFLFFSLILSYLFLLLGQTHEYNILSHSFHLNISSFIILCFLFLLFLLGLWILFSKIITNLFSIDYSKALSMDLLTYIPITFFLLLPFTTSHYLSSDDLISRIRLFTLAVLFSVFYLKVANIYRLASERPSFFKNLIKKLSSLSLKKKLILLFIIALILYNGGSVLMISGGITLSGDEPHFLLISHSLLEDGDFNLANNYSNKDYTKYMQPQVKIKPHTAPGTKGQYSFHSPGLSFLLFPFYILGSFFDGKLLVFIIRFGMSIFGALLGLQIFLFACQKWNNEKLALCLWFLFSFTAPVFFYSIHFYPEIIVAFFSFIVFRLLCFSKSFSRFSLFVSGFLISSFIWFHALKYIFIMVPLFVYSLWVLIKKHKAGWNLFYFLAPSFCLLFLYFLFQYSLYGSFSLSSISWRGSMTAPESIAYFKTIILDIPFRYRWETLAGYFFDQRDGLLLYSPIYFFAFLGAVEMIRRKPRELILIIFLTAPYILNSAFLTQRTGYAPQARPLVAISWVLAILVGYFLVYNAKKIFSYVFYAAAFLSLLFVYLLLKNPHALYQLTTVGETEHAGKLFLLFSNLHFSLPKFLPSYLKIENLRWIPNYIWIVVLLLFVAIYHVVKKHSFSFKFSFHILVSSLGILVFFLCIVLYPRTVLQYPRNTTFPSGQKITFYSLGRVARMIEPGKLYLPEDNRPYIFYFTSWRKIKKFQIDFGSFESDCDVEIKFFDFMLFQGNTAEEIKTIRFPSPPSYRLKNTNLYRISIYLEKKSGVLNSKNPYIFSILPFS